MNVWYFAACTRGDESECKHSQQCDGMTVLLTYFFSYWYWHKERNLCISLNPWQKNPNWLYNGLVWSSSFTHKSFLLEFTERGQRVHTWEKRFTTTGITVCCCCFWLPAFFVLLQPDTFCHFCSVRRPFPFEPLKVTHMFRYLSFVPDITDLHSLTQFIFKLIKRNQQI